MPSSHCLFFLLTTLALSGCSYFSDSRDSTIEVHRARSATALNTGENSLSRTESLCDYQWLLKSLSVDGREHRAYLFRHKIWRKRPYLTCDKLGYVRGRADKNPYLGKFLISENGLIHWIKPPKIFLTGSRNESSSLEKDYLQALSLSEFANLSGEYLILTSNNGHARIEFKRVEN